LYQDGERLRQRGDRPVAEEVDTIVCAAAGADEGKAEAEEGESDCVFIVRTDIGGGFGGEVGALRVIEKGDEGIMVNRAWCNY
jgi:hypothetical protein